MARARRPSGDEGKRSKRKPDRRRIQAALRELVQASGARLDGELRGTPKRAADFWCDHLLAGERLDPCQCLASTMPSRSSVVSLLDIDVHLVCPHHLTIAFGTAHLAYLPVERIVSLGSLADLVTACTARLVLQETATAEIADALVEHLGADAAVAVIEAKHPCNNVTRPRTHRSRVVTWASAGKRKEASQLRRLLIAAHKTINTRTLR